MRLRCSLLKSSDIECARSSAAHAESASGVRIWRRPGNEATADCAAAVHCHSTEQRCRIRAMMTRPPPHSTISMRTHHLHTSVCACGMGRAAAASAQCGAPLQCDVGSQIAHVACLPESFCACVSVGASVVSSHRCYASCCCRWCRRVHVIESNRMDRMDESSGGSVSFKSPRAQREADPRTVTTPSPCSSQSPSRWCSMHGEPPAVCVIVGW